MGGGHSFKPRCSLAATMCLGFHVDLLRVMKDDGISAATIPRAPICAVHAIGNSA